MANPDPQNQFRAENQAALQHGAEGAVKRLRYGQSFLGHALEVLEGVIARSGLDLTVFSGLERARIERFFKLEAIALMFWDASLSAAFEGDIDKWTHFTRQFLHAGAKASREQDAVADLLANQDDAIILDAIKEAGDGSD